MQKKLLDEHGTIKDDFLRENFWGENVVTELDSWIAFYFKHGRFPASQELIAIPHVKTPPFLKTNIPISPIDLYKKFAGTDAKVLVSIQGLAALNIYLGGNRFPFQHAMYEYLNNLTYQALSQENDKVFMVYSHIRTLVNDLLECFVKKENKQIEKSSILSEKIRKLKTDFKDELWPEFKIQMGEEEPEIIEPIETSTPLKTEERK